MNTELNTLITGATGNLTFQGTTYNDEDTDLNGLYSWVINTSQLNVGSYSFSVTFNKSYYQPGGKQTII